MSAFNGLDMLLRVMNFQLEDQVHSYLGVEEFRKLERTARAFKISSETRPLLESYMKKAKVSEFTRRLFTRMFEEATATADRIQAENDNRAVRDARFRDLRNFVLYAPGRGNVFYYARELENERSVNWRTAITYKVTLSNAPDSIVLHSYIPNCSFDIQVSALSDQTMFRVDVHAIDLLSGRQFDAGFKLRRGNPLIFRRHVFNNLYH